MFITSRNVRATLFAGLLTSYSAPMVSANQDASATTPSVESIAPSNQVPSASGQPADSTTPENGLTQPSNLTPYSDPAPQTPPRGRSERRTRLARMPKMYGDLLLTGSGSYAISILGTAATFPISGISKIAENNSPMPQNRIFFVQQHFHNAIEIDDSGSPFGPGPSTGNTHVNRSIFGFEKTFLDKMASVEFRFPFQSTGSVPVGSGFETDYANFDGLTIALKMLAYEREDFAISFGLSTTIPIGGEDSSILVSSLFGDTFTVDHETLHLSPFVGASAILTVSLFWQGFVQIDFPIDDDDISFTPFGLPTVDAGRFSPPALLHLDSSLGAWLYRNENASFLTGLAGLLELHFTQSISDTPTTEFDDGLLTAAAFSATSGSDISLFHMTAGIHAEIMNQTTLRVGAVVPLLAAPDRSFDTEIQLSINRHF